VPVDLQLYDTSQFPLLLPIICYQFDLLTPSQ